MRPLLVEDEPKTREYLRPRLTEEGFVIDSAADGLDGLHLAQTADYNLVLLDVMLPGVNCSQGVARAQGNAGALSHDPG